MTRILFLMASVAFIFPCFDLNAQTDVRPYGFQNQDKIFAVSDIEGELDGFRNLLVSSKIIGPFGEWKFGKGHLVVCGDLLDRGAQVPELLEFLMGLEVSAKELGGQVHVLLGNHDLMNFSGIYRDVNKKYLYPDGVPLDIYLRVIGKGTRIGDWLRSKNVVEMIGSTVFLHAGISEDLLKKGWSLEEINSLCRSNFDVPRKGQADSVRLLFGESGPFWYRGYFMGPRASMSQIDQTLKFYGASRIVVGHTIVRWNMASYYEAKVIGIDVDAHKGQFAGLLISGKRVYAVNDKGEKKPLKYNKAYEAITEEDIL